MSEGELADLIPITKAKVGDLISKPKMSDKLLNKPPFRFLHDTIMAIISTTGFGEGLYGAEETDSAAITDKGAKIAYLEKIFTLVGICKGGPLSVKATKVVSGLEAEHTNAFLIALAECASDASFDSVEAVRRCLNGEQPGQKAPPTRSKNSVPAAESKNDHPSPTEPASSKAQQPPSKGDAKASNAPPPMDAKSSGGGERGGERGGGSDSKSSAPDMEPAVAPERGKSRGGTRGGKPNQASADTGLGGFKPNLDAEILKCDGSAGATQMLLGDIITRPKLTEKLLGKPPFRFLHDVVTEVIKATGFASTLYQPEELESANVTDKSQKIEFLEKIIKVVGAQLNTIVEARPAKIVAGLDAQNTNNFLQLMAVAARHLPDSRAAVRTVLGQDGGGDTGGGSSESTQPQAPLPEREREREPKSSRQQVEQAAAPMLASEPKEVSSSNFSNSNSNTARGREFSGEDKTATDDLAGGGAEGSDAKRSARPSTARRRPPKVKEGAKELEAKDAAPAAAKKAQGIIIDGADDDEDDDAIADETRLVDEVGFGAAADAKSSADPGAAGGTTAQSKLVKDIMSRQAEQEAAGRVANSKNGEAVDETKNGGVDQQDSKATEGAQGGGSGIRLGRLRKTGMDKKAGAGGAGAAGGAASETDLEKIRRSIQVLVQHTGPLGTCMDYIQEDITMMTSELKKWEDDCRKYETEYDESKRKTREILQPLKKELMDLEDQIIDQIARISSAKASNARNDDKIQQMLKLVATA